MVNGFKNTDIGLIPDDWGVINLKDNCILKARIGWQGLTTSEYRESGDYYLITGTDFKNGFIDWDNCVFVDKSRYDQDKNIQVQTKDVLITKDGTIGKVAYIDGISKPTTLNSGVFVLRIANNKLNSKFAYYILMSFYFDDFLKQITAGSTITHLYQKDFIHFNFVLPPLPEQQAIAEVLSDNDVWVESLEKLIAKKQQIKQGAMQKLLTPKEDWEIISLDELTKILTKQTGFDYSAYIKPALVQIKSDSDIPFIQNKDFNHKWINLNTDYYIPLNVAKNFPRILLDEKSLLISISGAIGNVGIYDKKNLAFIGGAVAILKFKNSDFIDWVMYYLTSDEGQSKLFGNVKAGSHQNLILDDIRKIEIPIPNIEEQNRIATILSDMDSEIEALEQKLAKAKQIKQGLMQELLTGRIRLLQKTSVEQSQPAKKHNDHFNDAVLIGTLASCFASEEYPMTRFKYTKVSYLLKRYKEEQTSGYLKKAAGPYMPQTRYGGAEKIALTKKYIASKKSEYKGKHYEGFVTSENVKEAIDYFKKWYSEDALQWISRFKFETNDNLELWATVDMAVQDLKNENKYVSVDAIKQVIKNNKEWKDKLKRTIFSDEKIAKAIIRLETLYTTV